MEKKAGIFLVNKDGKILMGHPTGHTSFWSIPKGKMEGDESPFQTAMRETKEESNVDLKGLGLDNIYELPMVKYKSKSEKCIYPFVILECNNDVDFDKFDVKCTAIIPKDASWNAGKPEFDAFAWKSVDECREMLHESQVQSLDLVQKIIDKNC